MDVPAAIGKALKQELVSLPKECRVSHLEQAAEAPVDEQEVNVLRVVVC